MSTPSIGSPIASSDEKVRIKCFLGEDIRVFHVSRRISYHDLSDLLSNYFNRPIELYQYEDNEEDRVTIHSSFDMEEAFAVYDHLKSVSQTLPTLRLYLKNASSNNNNNSRLTQSTPELLRDDSINNTPPSYLSDTTLNKKGIPINKPAVDTPPLRTPPPSPPPDSPFASMTPPLRTPPPSPPRSRKNTQDSELNEHNTDYKDKSYIDTKDNTPPLRTPPPTPPRSLVSSSEVEEDSSEDEDNTPTPKGSRNSGTSQINHDSSPTNNLYSQWKKGHKIGTGGFGDVFQGLNNDTGEFCAIKQLELEGATDEKTKRNLLAYQQEIEIMKKLHHPNIVRYLGTQIDGNIMSIFLEYVGGGSIRSILNKYGALSENNIRKYTKQILNGLKYLHSNNIVHRDIKGANILVTTEGVVKLADFGCAKIFVGIQSNVKSVLGTPYWMAPEVIRAEGYGRSADVWSLGCTIIEMATLKPPWCNDFGEPAAAMFHIASSNETPQIPEHLSPEAHDFLVRCFKRDPKERPDAVQLLNHTFINGQNLLDMSDPSQLVVNNNTSSTSSSTTTASTSAPATSSNNSTSLSNINSLPTDLLLNIFCYIEPRDHGNVSSVCKTWKGCIQDDMIWRHKTLKRWRKIRKEEQMRWKELYSSLEIHDKYWLKSELLSKSIKGKSHSKCINHVTMFDAMIVTSSDDKKLKIWSTEKQKLIKTLKGHTDSVNCAYITDNGGQIFSGSSDKSIKLWNVKSKKIVKSFEGHTDSVSTLHYGNSKLISGSRDKSILIWDPTTGKLLCTLNGHKGGINAVQYVDSTIISASADNTLKIFDARTEKCTRTIEGHADEVTCIQFDRDNYTVLSGSADKSIKEWDLRLASQECIHTYSGHTDWVRSISVDANKIISGSQDKTVKIWNRHRDKLEQTLNGHTDSVLSVQHDKKKILSVGKDKQLRIWAPKEEGNNSVPSTPKLLLKKFM